MKRLFLALRLAITAAAGAFRVGWNLQEDMHKAAREIERERRRVTITRIDEALEDDILEEAGLNLIKNALGEE